MFFEGDCKDMRSRTITRRPEIEIGGFGGKGYRLQGFQARDWRWDQAAIRDTGKYYMANRFSNHARLSGLVHQVFFLELKPRAY